MSVDLSITLMTPVDTKYIGSRLPEFLAEMTLEDGEICFNGMSKCQIIVEPRAITLSTNSELFDFAEFAALAIASIVDRDEIFDPQDNKVISVSQEALEKAKEKITAKMKNDATRIVKIIPKSGLKFRLSQIEKAINELNSQLAETKLFLSQDGHRVEVLYQGGNSFTIYVDENLMFLEAERPKRQVEIFQKVMTKLSDTLL